MGPRRPWSMFLFPNLFGSFYNFKLRNKAIWSPISFDARWRREKESAGWRLRSGVSRDAHLLGLFVWLRMLAVAIEDLRVRGADDLTLTLTSAAYIMCLLMPLFSSCYHLFKPVAHDVARGCLRLDMAGILSLWFARVLLEGYYVTWCDEGSWEIMLWLSVPLFASLAPLAVARLDKLWPLIPCFLLAHAPLGKFRWIAYSTV